MKRELFKYIRFILGLFIAASGTVFMIQANLGLSPWDVLHQGIAYLFHITIGQGNIIISVGIFILAIILGAVVGSGSIIATFIFGIFVDLIIYMKIIPSSNSILSGLPMLILGTFIFAYGIYMSIREGLGCGPRDSFMLVTSKKAGINPGRIRNFMEIATFGVGYLMGGDGGVGTAIVAFCTGFFLQKIFVYHSFDPSTVKQRNLKEEMEGIYNWNKRRRKIKTT